MRALTQSAARAFAGLCDAAGVGTIHGVVERVLDARRKSFLLMGERSRWLSPLL